MLHCGEISENDDFRKEVGRMGGEDNTYKSPL
jgi:hypothetical protein